MKNKLAKKKILISLFLFCFCMVSSLIVLFTSNSCVKNKLKITKDDLTQLSDKVYFCIADPLYVTNSEIKNVNESILLELVNVVKNKHSRASGIKNLTINDFQISCLSFSQGDEIMHAETGT
jgi:hypothetical protein